MSNSIATSTRQPFPMVLRYTDIRSYLLTAVFVSTAVAVPWVFHQFHLAGPTFLPMHIFVLLAGLLFGWRAGVAVGVLSPVISHAVSGLPVLAILPQIAIELSAYGLIAGVLREKYHLRPVWSLLAAMIGGRLALLLALLLVYLLAGQSYSPLGGEPGPFAAFSSVIQQGWPGIAIQLLSIPAIVWLVGKFAGKGGQA